MQRKRSVHIPKGMTKDVSDSKLGSEYYIDALNIRLTAQDDNTLMSITNAKGNKQITLDSAILGSYLGHAVLNSYIVIFTVNDSTGYIYRIDTENNYHTVLLAYGPFGFDTDHPIETLPMYEKEDVQKIYWIDGKNQPRFINIADKIKSGIIVPRTSATVPSSKTAFDFVATMALNEKVTVTRNEATIGTISAGTIQYALTYYNLYGQETNIFHQSSLNYISYNNRGASPEDTTVSASFTLKLENLDSNFEFVRIYAIHRTSLNAVPTVRRVVDLPVVNSSEEIPHSVQSYKINGNVDTIITGLNIGNHPIHTFNKIASTEEYDVYATQIQDIEIHTETQKFTSSSGDQATWNFKVFTSGSNVGKIEISIDNTSGEFIWYETTTTTNITFTDDGSTGELVDPTIMLFVGGKTIIPQAMSHKDNTLFFGNYQEQGSIVSSAIKSLCKNAPISFSRSKSLEMAKEAGYYSYKSSLTKSLDKISTFKYLEWYRFGIQAQKATGEWSEPIYIKDLKNELPINYSGNNVLLVEAKSVLPESVKNALKAEGYVNVRPLVVYPTLTDRECICQGVVNPTVFNVEDRNTNSPWCQSSWFFRPNSPIQITSGGSPVTPSYKSVYCLHIIEYDRSYNPKAGDYIWVDFYRIDPGYTARCRLKVLGITTNVERTGGYGHDNYAMLAVEIDDPNTYTFSDLISDNSAYTRYLKVYNRDDNNAVIGEALYSSGGVLGIISSLVLESVLPATGSSAIMSWNPQWSWTSDSYTWRTNLALIKNNSETTQFYLQAKFKVTSSTEDAVLGTIPEFRHWQPLASAKKRNGEIQCNFVSTGNLKTSWTSMGNNDTQRYAANFIEKVISINPKSTDSSLNNDSYVDQFSDMFFVDQSVVTFHSPDIEFDTNTRSIDNSLLKMRIVGYVPITATISDVDIQTSSIQLNYRNTTALPRGFWHETVGNTGYYGIGSLNAAPMWYDDEYHGNKDEGGENKKQYTTAFMTYPWHRNGSLNNQNAKDSNNYRSAVLKRKIMSNLRFSYKSYYLEGDTTIASMPNTQYNLSGISLFDSNEIINSRINGNLTDSKNINYYGNVDKIVSSSRVFRIDSSHQVTGYPIFKTSRFQAGASLTGYHNAYTLSSVNEITDHAEEGDVSSTQKQQRFGSDPVSIKYKSTPHAVLALQGDSSYKILPTAKYNGIALNTVSGTTPFWSTTYQDVKQSVLPINMNYGWLWLVELYNDNVQNRFGGTSDNAIENNTWLPCGQPVSIDDAADSTKGIKWTEGDTFFQRYDCLKTYPFTNEDTNSVVDILSFMVETRVNIDGRYDRNRGQNSNLQMSPINFNLLNHVYSQNNNFFSYRTLDKTLFNVDTYKNYITWTKKKTPGEEVDTWTNITLANVLDLDGDKGNITALKRFNNSLFAFQDKAFSQILYNENTQLSTTAGVPIEIANSGKVDGKRYISETVGCANKWSIIESPYGLYFMNSNNASINLYNGQLLDLTSKYGFNSWARKLINKESWKPSFNTFRTFYDRNSKDVYFVNKDIALDFSETMNQFTSFISYENTPAMFNVANKFYAFKNGQLYEQEAGDYGVFFGVCKPYHITFIDNQDYVHDKIYTNLEFRAVVDPDMSNNAFNLPFDKLTANTDYQSGTVDFKPQQGNTYKSYPSLVRKFRIWRADIPRAVWTTAGGIRKQDRMRNPWIYLKLEKTAFNNLSKQNKIEMHDLIIDYYI